MRLLRVPGVFRPHSDSWLAASHIERQPPPAGATVLDLCSGSGVLGVTAARYGCEVVAVDASLRAVLATWLNGRLNGVRVRALRGDLFAPVRGRRFDMIVSNPPYLPGQEQPPRSGGAGGQAPVGAGWARGAVGDQGAAHAP